MEALLIRKDGRTMLVAIPALFPIYRIAELQRPMDLTRFPTYGELINPAIKIIDFRLVGYPAPIYEEVS